MAMTIKEYEERVAKAEGKLKQIEKRIRKWEDAKSDDNFAKHFEWLKSDDNIWKLGWDGNKTLYGSFAEFKDARYEDYAENCDREIRSANRDKEDTIIMINKYKNAIELLKEKDAKPVIQIFKDFFNNWKSEIIEYVRSLVAKYYDVISSLNRIYNGSYGFGVPAGFESRAAYDAEIKRLEDLLKDIVSEPVVQTAIEKRFKADETEFNRYLDDYMNQRYFELVDKVTEIVGNIEDVSNLNVGVDGTLNGRVYGDKGGAKIETIIAGGYNIQVRHYRVLVHQIS